MNENEVMLLRALAECIGALAHVQAACASARSHAPDADALIGEMEKVRAMALVAQGRAMAALGAIPCSVAR